MAKIIINIDSDFDDNDAANACREVADLIEEGYTNGILANGKTWYIEQND